MYRIKLSDGTIIGGLGLNGNNFISQMPLTEDVFKHNLNEVVVYDEDEGTETTYSNMQLVQLKKYGGEWWFVLAEKTKSELEREKLYQLVADLTEVVLLGGIK